MALCKSTIPYLDYNTMYINVNFPHASQLSLSNPISSNLDLLYLITVTDIQCTFSTGGSGLRDSVSALLRKPEGFRGAPLFADDRATDPVVDAVCQIRPEPEDPTGLLYRLRITDFTRCGVLKRNVSFHGDPKWAAKEQPLWRTLA